jgi:hypothetical protein
VGDNRSTSGSYNGTDEKKETIKERETTEQLRNLLRGNIKNINVTTRKSHIVT